MSTNDIIRDFISRELMRGMTDKTVGDDYPLIDSGLIDSMGVMTLLAFLEKEFSVQIQGDDLVPENFATIAAISSLIERQRTA